MALNGNDLGAALSAAVYAVPDRFNAAAFWQAIGNALVDYLKANAVVTIASVSNVTPGVGTSGPGTGTVG